MSLPIAVARLLRLRNLGIARARARLLALRGARVGGKVGIGPQLDCARPWGIELGTRCELEAEVYLKLVADQAVLRVGAHTFIGRGVEFDVMEAVHVGEHTLIAPRCFITDHTHPIAAGKRIDQQASVARPVRIGSDVWLGAGCVVLAGVSIGDGAVVGANSVVTQDIAAGAVVAGAPARFLRNRVCPPG